MLTRLFLGLYGLCAALVFGAIVFLLVCPLIVVAPTLSLRRAIGRAGVRVALSAIGVPMRVRGLQHLPAGPCIAVSNHASYLDGVVLTSALPSRFTFVVQDGAADWPYVGLVIHRMGVSFINRSLAREAAAQTRALLRRVEEGESLAIFAEGTFNPEPGLLAFKKGAFLLAARAQVPVVPVAIRGTRRLYGDGHWLPRWSRVTVEILPALAPSAHSAELMHQSRAAVLAACGEPDLTLPQVQGEAA